MEMWTTEDARRGLCQLEDVGEERPIERIPDPPQSEADPAPEDFAEPAEPFRPLSKAERKQLALELMDKILIKAHGDPAAFMEDGSSQLNKFLEWANKADAEDNSANVLDMTAQSFNRMPPIEQDRALLDVITLFVPDERRQDALERLCMSQADYEALHVSAGRQRV